MTDSKTITNKIFLKIKRNQFLFEELVKLDFKQKYKRTVLGMGWSVLSPLLMLFVMKMVFGYFFGREIEHYTIYLFCGTLLFSYFSESTRGGMSSLMGNASVLTKVNVPKYLFLLSKNVSSLINFLLTLCVFFVFTYLDGIRFGTHFFALLFPVACLVILNLGMGMILSALFVFFRDIKYLYDVFMRLLMYCSAIFYIVPEQYLSYFMLNPIYVYIRYFRKVVLESTIPTIEYHLLCLCYAAVIFMLGCFIYKKYNHRFIFYF